VEKSENACQASDLNLNLDPFEGSSKDPSEEYVRLQWRMYRAILIVSFVAFAISVTFFDLNFSISLLLGSLSGVLYLRLLARSIGKLEESSRGIGKVQLIVPVLLVLAVSKLPQLELLPALLGFLLYKPSLILQTLLES